METTAERRRASVLDVPLTTLFSVDWETVLYGLFIVVTVITRFWDLGSRAQHHDESMHAFYSWELYRGKGFVHNPLLHGPFLYHFTALMYFLFGATDFTSRVGPAIFGVGVVIMPYFLRKWLGRTGALVAAGMLAISPSFLYFSRFIRMDIFAAGWTLLAIVAVFQYLDQRRDLWLYVLVAAFSFLFSTKEVAFIHAFIVGTFLALLLARHWLRDGLRTLAELRETAEFDLTVALGTLLLPLTSAFLIELIGWDPLDYGSSGMMRSGIVLLILGAISVAVGMWWDRRRWLTAAVVYYAIFFLLHTTFLTNMQGFATGLIGSLGYWLSQQGVRRGTQPWYYYLILLPLYEFLPVLTAILGGVFVLRGGSSEERERRRLEEGSTLSLQRVFDLFLVYWLVLAMLVYGWAGEKMPWLVLHMALPATLLGARYLGHLLEDIDWAALREHGGMRLALLLPAFGLVLFSFLSVAPSGSKTIEDLNRTMQWIASGILLVVVLYGVYRVVRRLGSRQALRVAFLTLLALMTVLTVRTAWVASYVHGDIAKEMLIYTQTSPDVTAIMKDIRELSERLAGDKNLRVAYDNETSWPFTWYLRDYKNAQYFGEEPSGTLNNPVILVGTVNEQKVKPHINTVQYVRRRYALRWWFPEAYKRPAEWIRIVLPEEEANAWLAEHQNPSFWDAARMTLTSEGLRNVARFIVYREGIPEPLGSTDFVMYVRKDVVSDLWQYRAQAVATEPDLLQDEYLERYKEISAVAIWGSDQLRTPKDVAIGPEGNLYVADAGNHRVQKFSPQGELLMTVGGPGLGPGLFNADQGDNPWGVAVDQGGNVYVADTWGHRIQKFDADGKFVRQWGAFVDSGGDATGAQGQFWGPRDIAIDEAGDIYVTDTGNKRVQKFSPDGEFLGQWGGIGAAPGKFDEPAGIAVSDQTGDIFVADTWNQRIQRFDANFQPLVQWPIQGWEDQGVNNKPYLALDSQDNVYVTDPENHRVLKFDNEGEVLAIWGRFGTEKDAFDLPTSLAIDPAGRVYVTDSLNHRVMLFPPVN